MDTCYKEANVIPEDVGMSSQALANIDEVMEKAIADKVLKGMVTLVAREGKIVHYKAYGEADEGVPMEKDTICRLASMSKTIGAVALLQLQDQGKLLMSDPVGKYIPKFNDIEVMQMGDDGEITLVQPNTPLALHHLLTMTGGIGASWSPHPTGVEYAKRLEKMGLTDHMVPQDFSLAEYVDMIATIPLTCHPGEVWDYSNSSSNILGRVVEVVSGMRLIDYLQQNIFQPLGMEKVSFYPDKADWPKVAQVFASGSMEKCTGMDTNNTDDTQLPFTDKTGYDNISGGLCSDAYAYFRFAQMLANGGELDGVRILSPKAVELLSTNHVGDMRDYFYDHAWGYMVNVMENYNTTFNYLGLGSYSWHGYWGNVFNVWPDEDVVTVFLSQVSPEPPSWKVQEAFLAIAAAAVID